jgi:hypothetical protein
VETEYAKQAESDTPESATPKAEVAEIDAKDFE